VSAPAPRTVLVTRTADQAAGTALRLRERGHRPIIAPLVRIEWLCAPIDADAQAILVTSRNGAAALAVSTDRRTLPILAVGDATAAALREAGFADVRSADGDAQALATLAAHSLDPARGPVVHARGAEIRYSPLVPLRQAGFATAEATLYRTHAIHTLPPEAAPCDTALIYSPGSARRLMAAMPARVAPMAIIAISEAALAPMRGAPFVAGLHAAPHPSEEAMLTLLDHLPQTSIAPRAPLR